MALSNLSILSLLIHTVLAYPAPDCAYKHVIAISVDGFHGSDVEKYVSARPKSTIATLLQAGIEFTNAYTSAPSDSFPGTLAQYTGASPATTGVWYDDTWDRSFYAPESDCTGDPGTEVQYAENIDYNATLLFSGGIDPSTLPMVLQNGQCKLVYPHNRTRVNNVLEIAVQAGLVTAYTDKHPAYDLLRGPSDKGLTAAYFPEIAAVPNTVDAVISYDQLHVNAWLGWIDGLNQPNTEGGVPAGSGMPAFMGGNFQCLNVAQKVSGYNNDSSLSDAILKALDFVDSSLGKIATKLRAKGLYDDTLLIIASKHGQAPIDPKLYNKIDPEAVTNATGVDVAWQTVSSPPPPETDSCAIY